MRRRGFLRWLIAAGVVGVFSLFRPRRAAATGITEVGSGSQKATIRASNVDSASVAYPSNVSSGNLLLTCGAVWQTGSGAASVTISDTLVTSESVLLGAGASWVGGQGKEFIGYGIAPSSGADTVTVDPASTGNWINSVIDEFSGVASSPLDVDGGESTGTNSTPSDSLTTVTDNDLVVGVVDIAGAVTITPDAAFTELDEDETGARQPYSAIFQIVGAAGSYSPNWTLGSSILTWAVYSAGFKPAGATPAATPTPLRTLMGVGP